MPAINGEGVSVGELRRRMDELRSDVHALDTKVDQLPDKTDIAQLGAVWNATLQATTELFTERFLALAKRVEAIERWQNWAAKLVIGGVITAVLALVLSQAP